MEDIKNGILNQITFEIDKSGDFSSDEIEKIKNRGINSTIPNISILDTSFLVLNLFLN